MESFYSSDEDISWGPLTLREIKRVLTTEPPKTLKRRHTIVLSGISSKPAQPSRSDVPDQSDLVKEVENKLKLNIPLITVSPPSPEGCRNQPFTKNMPSPSCEEPVSPRSPEVTTTTTPTSSDYVDPLTLPEDSSIAQLPGADISTFPQSLKKAAMNNSTTVSPTSAEVFESPHLVEKCVSPSKSPNTELNFTQRICNLRRSCLLDNVNQTLVENTIILSSDEESDLEKSAENILIIEDSSETESVIESFSETKSVIESFNETESVIETQSVIETESVIETQSVIETKSVIETESVIESESLIEAESVIETEPVIETESAIEAELVNIKNKIPNTEQNFSKLKNASNDYEKPELDDMSTSEIFKFNDTLEDMELLLKQGLNYSDSPNKENTAPQPKQYNSPRTFTPENKNIKKTQIASSGKKFVGSKIPCKTPNRVDKTMPVCLQGTPVSKSASKAEFKVPRPVLSKVSPYPKSNVGLFNNILSPVAHYIKNTPTTPLRQNVPHKIMKTPVQGQQKCHDKIQHGKAHSQEKIKGFESLPEVVYKPAKRQLISKESEPKIAGNIKKLIGSQPIVIKHEARIHKGTNKPLQILDETDLTVSFIDDSVLNDSSQDVSVWKSKQAYIK